jgi:hypothetical protein
MHIHLNWNTNGMASIKFINLVSVLSCTVLFSLKLPYIFLKPGHSFLNETQYPVNANSVRFLFAWRYVSFRKLRRQTDRQTFLAVQLCVLKLRLIVLSPQSLRLCCTFWLNSDGVTMLLNARYDCECFPCVPTQIKSLSLVSHFPSYCYKPFHVNRFLFILFICTFSAFHRFVVSPPYTEIVSFLC